jgi:hypothetical protein
VTISLPVWKSGLTLPGSHPNLSQAPTGHYLYPTCSIIQEAHKTNVNGKLSHLHLLDTYLECTKTGSKFSFVCCRNHAMHIIFLLASEAPYKSVMCFWGGRFKLHQVLYVKGQVTLGLIFVLRLRNSSYNYCAHCHALKQHSHALDHLHFPNT